MPSKHGQSEHAQAEQGQGPRFRQWDAVLEGAGHGALLLAFILFMTAGAGGT